MLAPGFLAGADRQRAALTTEIPPFGTTDRQDVEALANHPVDFGRRVAVLLVRALVDGKEQTPFGPQDTVGLTGQRAIHDRPIHHHNFKLLVIEGKLRLGRDGHPDASTELTEFIRHVLVVETDVESRTDALVAGRDFGEDLI